ncbi:hypothetical protein A2276_01670 [candidate division WOR-1 bacterium RIFOXYA12_FULL_43_27]|uniref:HEPN domain-containing protein n=1 Tax=candidate division WOR-1 bacterium RIFOXYC2_FULL_46_14 TaxID=1802587 RepID=A0A1F4U6T4_UNCSA|nr:MAG: hypothetical protein A2276_01670 [candidate division WOR-1 bacterium RIFOXYA12_FULL_43_27]OGC19566.1 MAG: hypothetical protein A2292_02660 [candidate division WOR-1 bacterium RIFOXYB2_FULL_46_45]OGC30554.1 MAG: hypothetical protein A2232_02660 [candidate division WOR-1 bacterium RIFOXYA2_FULL_46_56]OGC40621.1 MAG: hypothetical protein A2438_06375 [candidate division WOR-1 bacterium RIFOXYC2_FULL_46_14]
MKSEKSLIQEEWLGYAKDDLESAELLLKKSDNYHISVYHSHQAIEKIFKWFLLKNNREFPFIHDLKELFKLVEKNKNLNDPLEELSFLQDLYPQLRYPTGDKISKEEAEKSLQIAKKIFKLIADPE